jgi:hypothetical protein
MASIFFLKNIGFVLASFALPYDFINWGDSIFLSPGPPNKSDKNYLSKQQIFCNIDALINTAGGNLFLPSPSCSALIHSPTVSSPFYWHSLFVPPVISSSPAGLIARRETCFRTSHVTLAMPRVAQCNTKKQGSASYRSQDAAFCNIAATSASTDKLKKLNKIDVLLKNRFRHTS